MAAVSFCALSVALFPFALAGRSGHILARKRQAPWRNWYTQRT